MQITTLPFDPTAIYYVIVGCGFSAITNHALLLAQKKLGSRVVLHIGSADPWSQYYPMPMGQWPPLLTLPGFWNKPANLTRCGNLNSDEFADVNNLEWATICVKKPFAHLNTRVTGIRQVGNPPYEVDLDSGQVVKADYVDICGGPGPATGPSASMGVDAVLLSEFQGGSIPAGTWPRLVSGEAYLSVTTPRSPANGYICVIGGGPTAAWCVERAEVLGSTVVWLSQDKVNNAFIASRRNDGLIALPVTRTIVNGNHVVDGDLQPRSPNTTFGEGIDITGIKVGYGGKVDVTFKPAAAWTPRFTNHLGTIAAPTHPFDQVVVAIGQATSYAQAESWASILKSILASAISTKTHLIWDREKKAVGLQAADGRVRLLGAAALSHPDLVPEWRTPGTPSNLFFRSLTEQSRVPIGITLAALTVAEANGAWSKGPNNNLNTAGILDLQQLMAVLPAPLDSAQTWFESRGSRIPPFDFREFSQLMMHKTEY